MNPQLTAAQERAREIIKEMFLANFCDGDSWDDASASCFTKYAALDIAEFFWNEAEQVGVEKEKALWLSGVRCNECGGNKNPDGLSDMCDKCFQEARHYKP